MRNFNLLFLFINLSYGISTMRVVSRQIENETVIMNDDIDFSALEIDAENFTDPSINCTGEFWQPSSHKGRPVCLKFISYLYKFCKRFSFRV